MGEYLKVPSREKLKFILKKECRNPDQLWKDVGVGVQVCETISLSYCIASDQCLSLCVFPVPPTQIPQAQFLRTVRPLTLQMDSLVLC